MEYGRRSVSSKLKKAIVEYQGLIIFSTVTLDENWSHVTFSKIVANHIDGKTHAILVGKHGHVTLWRSRLTDAPTGLKG
uniref:Uncharacterized protein n=1 Tax=Romanomermis culicivorax TaxID=13658 RepID=A0A915L4G2_ROMCU